MELFKAIEDAAVQIDLIPSKNYIFDVPHFVHSSAQDSEDGEILPDKINFCSNHLYEVPLEIIELEEVTLDELGEHPAEP
jgi:hypothetical protein